MVAEALKFAWWGRRDSNPHALRHMILSHACLPVPTLPRLRDYSKKALREAGLSIMPPGMENLWDV